MVSQAMREIGCRRSAIREAYEYGLRRAAAVGAERVFDFSLGNPSAPPPPETIAAFLDVLSTCSPDQAHGYTVAPGSPETREAVAASLNRRFQTDFSARNLYLTCGAAAALSIVFRALTIDGDSEFLAFAPFFPEYECFARTAGAQFAAIPADTHRFQIDFDRLERALGPHTQGVIVNSPNNPSGVIYSEQTLRTLAQILKRKCEAFGHPIYLISDEPYRELRYTDERIPFITELYDAAIVCYSYSKSLSLPGDRIGYALLGTRMPDFDDVYGAIAGSARIQGYVCAPAVLQRVIERCSALDVLPDLSGYRRNRDALCGGLTGTGYRCVPPDGAFYLFVEAPGGDGDAFAALARSEDILVVSGRSFGCPGFVRVSYCVPHEMILRAMPGFRRLYERARAR